MKLLRLISTWFRPLRLYPVIHVTGALIFGICAHWYGLALWHMLLVAAGCATVGCLLVKKRFQTALTLIFMAAALLLGYLRADHVACKHRAFLGLLSTHTCTLYGTVSGWQETGNPRLPVRLTLDVSWLKSEDQPPEKITGSHQVYIFTQRIPACMVGDIIRVKHACTKIPNNKEYQQYLAKEDVAATIFMPHFSYQFVRRPAYSVSRWLFYTREGLIKRLKQKLSPSTFDLCTSVFYGYPAAKKDIDPVKNYFKMWGVVHYLARSGLHLVIFILTWQFLLGFVPLPFRAKELFLLLLCTIYYLLSWPSVPFDRSYVTHALHKFSMLCLLRTYYLSSFALVTLIMLAYNPVHLFFLDFQLSFGITCALALFNHMRAHQIAEPKSLAS